MDITKQVTFALHVVLDVVLGPEKRLLVLRQLIVFVVKIRAVVPTVPLLPELLALHTMLISVRLVLVIITRLVKRSLIGGAK